MPEITEKDLPRPVSRTAKPNLERIDKALNDPLPTPEKGDWVGWVPTPRYRTTEKEGLPAVVLRKVGPGQVELHVLGLPWNEAPIRPGCTYIDHPDVLKGGKVPMSQYGYWYYLGAERKENFEPPKAHYEWHKKSLLEQRQRCLMDELRRQNEAIEREAAEAEKEAERAVAAAK